jgi:thiamine-monophosphate kinase
MSPYEMGAKSTVMAISDLAAKGVQPLFVLASGTFPNQMSVDDTINIVEGISDETHKAGAKYLGGDTNEADDIMLSIVAAGIKKKDLLIKRNGAQKGDVIFTTGKFGLTGAGFKVFIDGFKATKAEMEKFRKAIYKPEPRLVEGLKFAEYGKITSCIDSSDGLSWCLKEILRDKKDLGIEIDDIPIDDDVEKFADKHTLSIIDLAFYAGEEFELVLTIASNNEDEFLKFAKKEGIRIFKIGRITDRYPGRILYKKKGKIVEIKPKGWEHFK